MKNLLFILFFACDCVNAQHLYNNRWTFGPGEYNNWIIDNSSHRLYQLVDLPFHYSVPDSFMGVGGGAHHAVFFSQSNRAWAWGDNSSGECGNGNTTTVSTPTQISADSLGNNFGSIIKVMTGGTGEINPWNSFFLKSDGTLWGCGSLAGGLRGNGTFGGQTTRPVQIPFPAGTFITDADPSFMGLVLDSTGSIWTWAADYGFYPPYLLAQGTSTPVTTTPTKITSLPAKVKMIAGGDGLRWFALLSNGQVYGAAWHISYLGFTRSGDMSQFGFNPARVDTCWHIPGLGTTRFVDSIVVNSMYTYLLLTDSTWWGFGSNAIGNAGDGTELNMRTYTGTNGYAPYNWDQGLDENMYYQAKQICPGMHNFTKIFASTALNFWGTAENAGDSVFVCGRNKGGVIGNMVGEIDSVAGNLGSSYPNSWDVVWPTYITPFNVPSVSRTTSPLCKDSAGAQYCSISPNVWDGSKPAPTVSAGSNQTITSNHATLSGTVTVASGVSGVRNVQWSQVSGPTTAVMPLVANNSVNVYNLSVGTYVFSLTGEDSNFKTTTSNVTVNVTQSNAITVPTGVKIHITH